MRVCWYLQVVPLPVKPWQWFGLIILWLWAVSKAEAQ
jgi:hypothetical protein